MNETINNAEDIYDVKTSPTNLSKNNDDIGNFFVRFLKVLTIHKWLFLTIFLIVILLVMLYALRQPVSYQSNYEVFYNENIREFVDDNTNSPVVKSDFDKNYWLRAMQSDEVMELTKKNSGLPYSASQLNRMILTGVVDKRKEDRIPVFLVQINSHYKEHIPILIRAYINALNDLLYQKQIRNSQNLIAYLTGQINQNNAKLIQLNVQIADDGGGTANNEIVDFDKIKTSLDDFRNQLLNARVNLSSIISARKRTETELAGIDGTVVNESAFSEPLKVQLMNLEVDLARALTKNKEDHPAVKQIRANIKQISDMLRDSLEQRLEIKSLIQNPIKSQLMSKLLDLQIQEVSEDTRVRSLEQVIGELEKKTLPTSVNQDQQQQLRNRDMLTLTIKGLNDKLIEAQSTSHGSLSRFAYIDDASSINLANKGILFYIILAILVGFLIASLIVFIYDLLDDRIMLVEDYEHFYSYPLIGIIKHYKDEEDNIDAGSDYRQRSFGDIGGLIVNLRQVMKHNHIKTLVISSPDRMEGKSLVSLKLAAALAMKKQRVLLIDMDFYSPKLTKKIYPDSQIGLSNYIMDECGIEDIILSTDIPDLNFVAAGNAEGQKDLFYNDSRLATFIEKAKDNYDVVMFDTPAAMYIPDIVEFFDLMDSIIVIARLRRTTRKLLDRLFKTVSDFKSKYIGVIINDLRADGRAYYDNYQYGYSYNYSDYKDNSTDGKGTKKRIPKKSVWFSAIVILVLGGLVYYYGFNNSGFKLFTSLRQAKDSIRVEKTDMRDKETFTQDTLSDSVNIATSSVSHKDMDSVEIHKDSRLTNIALQKYGNKCFWVYIYLANKTSISNPNELTPGTIIYLPDPTVYDIDANDVKSINAALDLEKQIISGL
ncbi:MAG: AAA family ATPase [Paludibacter sp.]|nr:AAA family ATPase [Paludibacter sp.]